MPIIQSAWAFPEMKFCLLDKDEEWDNFFPVKTVVVEDYHKIS
jgi:hypothetical protein